MVEFCYLLCIESVIKVKLWQPEDAPQTAEDLSELDPCPTLYDRIINEAG